MGYCASLAEGSPLTSGIGKILGKNKEESTKVQQL